MRKFLTRAVAAVVIAASVALVAPLAAYASGTQPNSGPAPTTSTSTTTSTYPQRVKHLDLSQYKQARQEINQTFKNAVFVAQAIFQSAKRQATNAAGRSTARAAYELALAQAVEARDIALTNLGKPPSH
jgi:predicted PurR-regulated permease PerM